MIDINILEYKDNFADNLTSIAYGEIIKEKYGYEPYFRNDIANRKIFEEKMKNFNLECRYISKNRIENISSKINNPNKIKSKIKNRILDLSFFDLNDVDRISNNILTKFQFNNIDFIKNFDILEKIKENQSIGVYIDSNDINNENLNYIFKAANRLNKYIKNPKLYIFSNTLIDYNFEINYEVIKLSDWREEFYFLIQTKHKIILDSKNSYSKNTWASILNQDEWKLVCIPNSLKIKNKKNNWIYIS